MITLISNLELSENDLVCKDKAGKMDNIAHIQGSLDGACAIYALIMNLLLIRVVKHKDTRLYGNPVDSDTQKLFSILRNENGMHKDGHDYIWLRKQLMQTFAKHVTCVRHETFNVDTITREISNDYPVIISIEGYRWAHALLAIGFESNSEGEITKLLCLDPGGEKPRYCYWNAFIDLIPKKNAQYKNYYSTSNTYVKLGDFLTIHKI